MKTYGDWEAWRYSVESCFKEGDYDMLQVHLRDMADYLKPHLKHWPKEEE